MWHRPLSRAASCQRAGTRFIMPAPICMQIHLAPLALLELARGSVWAQSHPSIWARSAPSACSRDGAFVKQEQDSHIGKVVKLSGPGLAFHIPVGWVCLFSAVTKVYISSFSHLCRSSDLQNGFPVWSVLGLFFFSPNENIKNLIANNVYRGASFLWLIDYTEDVSWVLLYFCHICYYAVSPYGCCNCKRLWSHLL